MKPVVSIIMGSTSDIQLKEEAEKILEDEMTGDAHLAVKLEIDMHTGNNWYEAK